MTAPSHYQSQLLTSPTTSAAGQSSFTDPPQFPSPYSCTFSHVAPFGAPSAPARATDANITMQMRNLFFEAHITAVLTTNPEESKKPCLVVGCARSAEALCCC
eukprot:5463292-Pleurochrysis_carterae.AAC.2